MINNFDLWLAPLTVIKLGLVFVTLLKVFADLVNVKIEKHQLNDLVRKGDRPEARGAFGAVYKRTLRTKVSLSVLFYKVTRTTWYVAVKFHILRLIFWYIAHSHATSWKWGGAQSATICKNLYTPTFNCTSPCTNSIDFLLMYKLYIFIQIHV